MRFRLGLGLAAIIGFSAAGCGSESGGSDDAGGDGDGGGADSAVADGGLGPDGSESCATPTECGALWEQRAADAFTRVKPDPAMLAAFAKAMPKGGDLHQHLNGAVYAETYLGWGAADGDCINSTTFAAVFPSACATTGNQPIPAAGTTFFDQILRAWSMKDFVAGAETGHDHFFATFGKYGLIAGAHRDDSIADVLTRAADENQLYIETMFNLGSNVGGLSASLWSGTLTAGDLQTLYDRILADTTYPTELTQDVTVVTNAATRYKTVLGCAGLSPPPACGVKVRFIAQVSRTGGNDQIFGQLVSAFEMAKRTTDIVGVNLSSPEDDTASLRNYDLHMAMLDFLYLKYTATNASPLQVTLHAGEVTPQYLPAMYANHNTFHIRRAVEVAHARRIGHGLDVATEIDSPGLLQLMRDRRVLVEICLSSNDQILEVRGAAHPLATYIQNDVPVALATDDQGVSRSSLAGEIVRAATDQNLDYRQLKTMARASLEHAFLPGASLWSAPKTATPVPDCAPTPTMGVGDPPSTGCQAFLAASERATLQWELERRFRVFEQTQ